VKINLLSRLGGGGFADVWKARDELDRDVAVKVVRASGAVMSSALAHARALARTSHPNIVSVISLEKVKDPDSGKAVGAIIMELIEGVTLETRLRGPKFSVDEARKLGSAIASAIAHIHERGMEHGDLHDANIMISDSQVKVIDLLYTDSLAMLSSGSRAQRLRRDCGNLRLILQHIIEHTGISTNDAIEFGRIVGEKATALAIQDALLQASGGGSRTEAEQVMKLVCDRITNENFAAGEKDATALAAETPRAVTLPLLIRITNQRCYQEKHRDFLQTLWTRLAEEERAAFVAYLAAQVDAETPKGTWPARLRMLWHLGRDGWRAVPPRFRLRLEQTLLKDVLLGRAQSNHHANFDNRGSLGTWASGFWQYFEEDKRSALADHLLTLLHKDVYTQNYVGRSFLSILPELAQQTRTTDQMIRALRSAVENEAQLVIDGMEKLPKEWVSQIRRKTPS